MTSKKVKYAKNNIKYMWGVIFLALTVSYISYLQMTSHFIEFWPEGVSDITGFYSIRFSDGTDRWVYSTQIIPGRNGVVQPVEYPVIIGLIIWLTKLITPVTELARNQYFLINAALIAVFFATMANMCANLIGKRLTKYLILSPAIFFSLYLNWDLIVMVPLIYSIYAFEKSKFDASAIGLAIAISAKFFPIVLLPIIFIIFIKKNQNKLLIRFLSICSISWITINLPFIIFFREGWSYFYVFSYKRGLGEGSIYSLISILGYEKDFSLLYITLNLIIFLAFLVYLLRSHEIITLITGSFWAVLVFTFFGKQYSMQYILWLTPLVLLLISTLKSNKQKIILKYYLLWQFSEALFNYAYFSNMLGEFSPTMYAVIGLFRYLILILFSLKLFRSTNPHWRFSNLIN